MSDRKLDIMIAEHMFKQGPWEATGYGSTYGLVICGLTTCLSLKTYSTSMSSAWRVVDKMEELGFGMVLSVTKHKVFVGFSKSDKKPVTKRDNAAECICVAALKALGVKI